MGHENEQAFDEAMWIRAEKIDAIGKWCVSVYQFTSLLHDAQHRQRDN